MFYFKETVEELILFLKNNKFKFDGKEWIKKYKAYLPDNDISNEELRVFIQEDSCHFYQLSDKYGKHHNENLPDIQYLQNYMNYMEMFSRKNKLNRILK